MRKIFRFLKVTIFSIIAIFAVLIVGIFVYFGLFFDLNQYKPMISQVVEEQTGRKFVIEGEANLGFSLVPTLELEKVSMENASWAKNKNMISLERLDVKISLLPLLKKRISVDRLILIKPEIFLEVNEEGLASWDFAKQQAKLKLLNQYAGSELIVTDASVFNALPKIEFMAKHILIEEGIVLFDNYQTKQHISIMLREVSLSAKTVDEDVFMKFDVVFNEEDIMGTAKVGSVKALLQSFEPYPFELKLKAFKVDAEIDGSVVNPLGTDIHYAINLDVFNPSGNFGAPKARFLGNLDGNLKEARIEITKLELEDDVITGNVLANVSGKIPYLNISLKSDLINLPKIMPKETVSLEMPSFVSSAYASQLVPETVIPYELLLLADADLKMDFGKIIVSPDVEIDGVSLKGKLNDGVFDINPLVLKFVDGKVNIDAKIIEKNKSIALNITTNSLVLQDAYPALALKDVKKLAIIEGGKTDVLLKIKSNGGTAREIARNLDGDLIAIVHKSKIRSGSLDLFSGSVIGNSFGRISELLNFKKTVQKEMTLNCGVVRADIKEGNIVFPDGIALDTDDFKVSSNGNVNLRNDRIFFNLTPFSGDLNDIANLTRLASSFIKVIGTIDSPIVTIDEAVVKKVVVAVAQNLTSSLFESSAAPCYNALKSTKYSSLFPNSSAGSTPKRDAGEVVKDVEKLVKDNAKTIEKTVRDVRDDAKGNLKKEIDSAKDLLKTFKF